MSASIAAADGALPSFAMINGKRVASSDGAVSRIVDPSTNEALVDVPSCTREDLDQAVCVAREAFDAGPWPRLPPAERARVLRGSAT